MQRESPSTLAPHLEQKYMGDDEVIECNRPWKPSTIPIVLLEETFTFFHDILKKPPTAQCQSLLLSLSIALCETYEKDDFRVAAIEKVLQENPEEEDQLELKETMMKSLLMKKNCKPDGIMSHRVLSPAIEEVKNNLGYAKEQAIAYYMWALSIADERGYRNCATRFPCILFVVKGSSIVICILCMILTLHTGPSLGFYGCVWNGHQVRVEPLSFTYDLDMHANACDLRLAAASALNAFLQTVKRIEDHYSGLKKMDSTTPRDRNVERDRQFPWKTSYVRNGETQTVVRFKYKERLNDEKLVFRAITCSEEKTSVIIKFAPTYSARAHEILVAVQSAPALLECSGPTGGWFAVCMQDMAEPQYQRLFDWKRVPHRQEQIDKVLKSVRSVVDVLHEAEFVHGDIRDTNILVDVGSDELKIVMLDFDWAGPVNDVRYPYDINPKLTAPGVLPELTRPEGVKGGGLILKEHYIEMIDLLFK